MLRGLDRFSCGFEIFLSVILLLVVLAAAHVKQGMGSVGSLCRWQVHLGGGKFGRFGTLPFCKLPEPVKYQGLTLGTRKEELIPLEAKS